MLQNGQTGGQPLSEAHPYNSSWYFLSASQTLFFDRPTQQKKLQDLNSDHWSRRQVLKPLDHQPPQPEVRLRLDPNHNSTTIVVIPFSKN